jgi:hypothetical protein
LGSFPREEEREEKRQKGRKIVVWWAKKWKWEAKKDTLRFWEAFQIRLGKAFKIDGTIYTPESR